MRLLPSSSSTLKCWYPCTKAQGITCHRTVFLMLTIRRTWAVAREQCSNWLMPCIELTTCRMCKFWTIVVSCVGLELQNLKLYIRHRLWNLQTRTASWCSYSQNSFFIIIIIIIWSSYFIDTFIFSVWLATCCYNHLLFTAVFWYYQAL